MHPSSSATERTWYNRQGSAPATLPPSLAQPGGQLHAGWAGSAAGLPSSRVLQRWCSSTSFKRSSPKAFERAGTCSLHAIQTELLLAAWNIRQGQKARVGWSSIDYLSGRLLGKISYREKIACFTAYLVYMKFQKTGCEISRAGSSYKQGNPASLKK